MPVTHTNRKGDTYYLHSGPKRGGGTQFYFSKKKDGTLPDGIPDGFFIHEHPDAMVYLRAKAGQLVTDEEIQQVRSALPAPNEKLCYSLDFKKDTITIHEANLPQTTPGDYPFFRSPAQILEFHRNHALYQPMMRFVLVDRKQNLFHPERYCFRGSIDTWIPIGEASPLPSLLKKYVVHLGKDSFYELF